MKKSKGFGVGVLTLMTLMVMIQGCGSFGGGKQLSELQGSLDELTGLVAELNRELIEVRRERDTLREKLDSRAAWEEDLLSKLSELQELTAEAQRRSRIIVTITEKEGLNPSQERCRQALSALRQSLARSGEVLEGARESNVKVLSDVELSLRAALDGANRCIENYGEVEEVFFLLDNKRRNKDGRTVPGGLNPARMESYKRTSGKILSLCHREGVVRLYGYSCDLGSEEYDLQLALDRAENLKEDFERQLDRDCAGRKVQVEADAGGILYLPEHLTRSSMLSSGDAGDNFERLREMNRVVTVFLFKRDF